MQTCLTEIKNQTYKEFRVLISDNASNDLLSWNQIVLNFSTDKRFIFFRQEKNVGFINNSQFLLSQANTKYFMWVADDDKINITFIEKAVKAFEQNKNAVICFSGWNSIDLISNPPIHKDFSRYVSKIPANNTYDTLKNFILQPEYYGKSRILWGLIKLEQLKIATKVVFSNINTTSNLTMAILPIEFYLLSLGKLIILDECLFTFYLLPTSAGLKENAIYKKRELEIAKKGFDAYRMAVYKMNLSSIEKEKLIFLIKYQEYKTIFKVIIYFYIINKSPQLSSISSSIIICDGDFSNFFG